MPGNLSSPRICIILILILMYLFQAVSAGYPEITPVPFDSIPFQPALPENQPSGINTPVPVSGPAVLTGPFELPLNSTEAVVEKPALVFSQELAFEKPYNESAVLVRFETTPGTHPGKVHGGIKARVIHDYSSDGLAGLELVALPASITVPEAISYYQAKPGILYAEPDYYRFSDRSPADPDFWKQWGMLNTGQVYHEGYAAGFPGADCKVTPAWDIATGTDSIVALIDSGVDYLHPDLRTNIWTAPGFRTYGYDSITGIPEPMDTSSHGTHCAGIIGAVGDDGMGIAGVNWHARIMPARFLNSFGMGTVSDEIKSILWAEKNGARIFCCPYGGSHLSRAEYDAMKDSDALFICAAGNDRHDTDVQPHYPSCLNLTNIISVAATDQTDNLSGFSSYGKTSVDIAAPGVDIYSTLHNTYQPVPIWIDQFDSLENWTVSGEWTLNQSGTERSGIFWHLNRSPGNSSQPALLTLKRTLNVKGIADPVISYRWQMNGTGYRFEVQGSVNGNTWTQLDMAGGSAISLPFTRQECKIPPELRQGPLLLRFLADGNCSLGLADITLSDGYGDLNETRYGYLSGTSMAAAFVSGAAGLIASASPDATPDDIRRLILNCTDPLPALNGRMVTGGRLNLSAAMGTVTSGTRYHLRLKSGWNHISVPYRLAEGNNTAGSLFGSLPNVSGHSLYRVSGDEWVTVSPGDQISPLLSYWLYSGTNTSVPLMIDQNQSGNYALHLTTGWSGIGFAGEEGVQAREALRSLSDIWIEIIGFNATTQRSEEPIIRGGSGLQNDTRLLLPYHGYWIYMTRNGTYEKKEQIMVTETQSQLWPNKLR
jgi:subtilisin family serine protease